MADLFSRVDALNLEAERLLTQDAKKAEALCCEALKLADAGDSHAPHYPYGSAIALLFLGQLAMSTSSYGQAFEYFQRSLILFEKSRGDSIQVDRHQQNEETALTRKIALARSYLGSTLVHLGNFSQAVETLNQALRSVTAIPDPAMEAEIYNELGLAYLMAGDMDLALNHAQSSTAIFKDLNDGLRLSWAMDTLGQIYLRGGLYQKALDAILEGMRYAVELKNWRDATHLGHQAGCVYQALGDGTHALEMFQDELEMARQYGLRQNECHAMIAIGDFLDTNGRHIDALNLLYEARKIAGETGAKPQMSEIYRLLSSVYKHLGDYRMALEYHERFHETDKAIFNREADLRLRNIQVTHQLEAARKEAEIYQLKAATLQKQVEENRRTQAELEHLAITDPLTNILNRRAFFECAEKIFVQALALHTNLAVVLVDIDHFKEVNDTYGHLVGDQVLTVVVERIRRHLRVGDRLARYGGEEFILLLNGMNNQQSMVTADRLRQAVGGHPVRVDKVVMTVTLSLGVAVLERNMPVENLDTLVAYADHALYRAKSNGRNCIMVYTHSSSLPQPEAN